jgi:hypothetical protein
VAHFVAFGRAILVALGVFSSLSNAIISILFWLHNASDAKNARHTPNLAFTFFDHSARGFTEIGGLVDGGR